MKQRILFDPHGGHSTAGDDDGKSTVADNVHAAIQKNIIPTITAHNGTAGWPDFIQAMTEHNMEHMIILGTEFGYVYKEKSQKYKGEIICLMPSRESLTRKMKHEVIDPWKQGQLYKTHSLAHLFDHVQSKLTKDEYDTLVWHLPHPVTIDVLPAGKMLARLFGKFEKLESPEVYTEEIARQIHTIEVYNAAHPGITNRMSVELARDYRFAHMGWAGASDSHHTSWIGSGATLVEADEYTAEGILEAMRQAKTVAVSGLGQASDTYVPFILWGVTVMSPMKQITDRIAQKTRVSEVNNLYTAEDFGDLQRKGKEQGWLR